MLMSEHYIKLAVKLSKLAERQMLIDVVGVNNVFGDMSNLIYGLNWFSKYYFDRHRTELIKEKYFK